MSATGETHLPVMPVMRGADHLALPRNQASTIVTPQIACIVQTTVSAVTGVSRDTGASLSCHDTCVGQQR